MNTFSNRNGSNAVSILLAVCPALFLASRSEHAALYGALLCFEWWGTVLFFRLTRPLFPPPLLTLSLVLWLAFFGEMNLMLGMGPAWTASLALLVLWDHQTEQFWKDYGSFFFIKGAVLGILLLGLNAVILYFQNIFPGIFNHPAGIFLTLAAAALFLPKPGGKTL